MVHELSLTGNEGEYLKRSKLDDPAFPHHSTVDQFEAYRSLGEHISEMFLPAITDPLDQTNTLLEERFRRLMWLGTGFDPLRALAQNPAQRCTVMARNSAQELEYHCQRFILWAGTSPARKPVAEEITGH